MVEGDDGAGDVAGKKAPLPKAQPPQKPPSLLSYIQFLPTVSRSSQGAPGFLQPVGGALAPVTQHGGVPSSHLYLRLSPGRRASPRVAPDDLQLPLEPAAPAAAPLPHPSPSTANCTSQDSNPSSPWPGLYLGSPVTSLPQPSAHPFSSHCAQSTRAN